MSYNFVVNPNQVQYLVDGHHRAGLVEDHTAPVPLVAQPMISKPGDINNQDALDEAIQEARAVKDLVCLICIVFRHTLTSPLAT